MLSAPNTAQVLFLLLVLLHLVVGGVAAYREFQECVTMGFRGPWVSAFVVGLITMFVLAVLVAVVGGLVGFYLSLGAQP